MGEKALTLGAPLAESVQDFMLAIGLWLLEQRTS